MRLYKKVIRLIDIKSYRRLFNYSKGYNLKLTLLIVLNSILSITTVYTAYVSKEIIDRAIDYGFSASSKYILLYLILFIVQLMITTYVGRKSVLLRLSIKNTIQQNFLNLIFKKKWYSMYKLSSGDITARVFDDINRIVDIISRSIPEIIILLVQLIAGFIFLYIYDPFIAFATLIISPVAIFISMYIGYCLRSIQGEIQENEANQWTLINESVSNYTIVKAFNLPNRILSNLVRLHTIRYKLVSSRNRIKISANLIMEIGYFLSFFIILALGTRQLSLGYITFGTLAAFLQIVDNIQIPIEEIARELPTIIASFSSLDRLQAIESMPSENTSTPLTKSTFDTLSINNVSFSYHPSTKILTDINLTLNNQDKIAILGRSGQGKTTLINLILSYLDVDSGNILVDGKPLTEKHRPLFSYVPQKNMVFAGSIIDNLFLDNSHSKQQIDLALKASCCHEFISQLEHGLDTEVFEGGSGLSEGQLQRICIARALIHQRPILIFDEATSALDETTETNLISNLLKYYPSITLIAITHRNSITTLCNKVYHLNHGVLLLHEQ